MSGALRTTARCEHVITPFNPYNTGKHRVNVVRVLLAAIAVLTAPYAAMAVTPTTIHSFGAAGDGQGPNALILYKGALYGTTSGGGASNSGTMFKLDPHTGAETQLYSFTGAADGAAPLGALLAHRNVFYGTTSGGGANGSGPAAPGTIFEFDPATGIETVLYSFTGGADGSHPHGGLVAVGGYLYGTASSGAQNFSGTVFRINLKTKKLTVLHSFDQIDGEGPYSGLVLNTGILYGTTVGGGLGNGVVFTYTPSTNSFVVLHYFATAEGSGLYDELTPYNGLFYGTAYGGGASGSGTVFKMDPTTGAVTVLHNFAGSPDGGLPTGGLASKAGLLFGTTSTGGPADVGVIFRVNPARRGAPLVYSFTNGADGEYPGSTLVLVGKWLFGTTGLGGVNGGGAVFKIR